MRSRLWHPMVHVLRILIAIISSSLVYADSEGSYLWNPPWTNEANVYARAIELQHAGDLNGRLLATWEHWYTQSMDTDQPNGLPGSFIIRESEDNGNSWRTLAVVNDPRSGPGRPCARFWQPFLFEFPRALGKYPEGTLVLVGNLVPQDASYTSFFLWRSFDHGKTWTPGGEWDRSGTFLNGIWEPFLFLDSHNRLVAMFSDERYTRKSQTLVKTISEDGGDSWKHYGFAVISSKQNDRPGMATVAKMDNGQYALAYEYCGTANCQIYVKVSENGWDWDPISGMGNAIFTTDNLYPVSSPYMVWEPRTKQLIVASSGVHSIRNNSAPESHRVVFTNSQYGRGQWKWSPAPWNVRGGSATCNSNYSPNLLVRANGKIRLTAPASEGSSIKCSERTGEAFVGVMPYNADFGVDGQSGWIDFGGEWFVSGNDYGYKPIGDHAAIAITGSSGWTTYKISSDVMITSQSGQIGVVVHVSASSNTRSNSLQGYSFTVGNNNTADRMVITREGTDSKTILSIPAPWSSLQPNKWYRLSLSYQENGILAISAAGPLADDKEEGMSIAYEHTIATGLGSSTDNDFGQGMAGLVGRNGGGRFRNVQIIPI